GRRALIDTMLTVAVIPGHPFNAFRLHNYLDSQTMPQRDAWWLPYLHDGADEDGPVARLISWAWDGGDKSHLDDPSIELAAIALIWFLASSNRVIRDRSTKALVALV